MSDILPKFKMYTFISIITLFFNVGVSLFSENFDFGLVLQGVGTAFLPFASLLNLINFGLPNEFNLMFGIVTTLMSIVQIFLLAMMILAVVHNLIWNPDV